MALDGSRNLYIADTGNNRVREVSASTARHLHATPAERVHARHRRRRRPGRPGRAGQPEQEAFDAQGDIYIADAGNNRVQEIAASTHTQFGIAMTAGDVYTVAGQADGQPGCQCDGGPATNAYLNDPRASSVDAAGNLYIADTGNNRIQEVPAATGIQWGQSMTAGYIYTVAGSSTAPPGTGGDGGPADVRAAGPPAGAWRSTRPATSTSPTRTTAGSRKSPPPAGTHWGTAMTAGDIYTVAGSPTGTLGQHRRRRPGHLARC